MEQEIAAIKDRLQTLEAQRSVMQDQLWSHQQVLVTILRLLHERGHVALPDVIAALQSRAAFGQAAFDIQPPELLGPFVEMLQEIADVYATRGPTR